MRLRPKDYLQGLVLSALVGINFKILDEAINLSAGSTGAVTLAGILFYCLVKWTHVTSLSVGGTYSDDVLIRVTYGIGHPRIAAFSFCHWNHYPMVHSPQIPSLNSKLLLKCIKYLNINLLYFKIIKIIYRYIIY